MVFYYRPRGSVQWRPDGSIANAMSTEHDDFHMESGILVPLTHPRLPSLLLPVLFTPRNCAWRCRYCLPD